MDKSPHHQLRCNRYEYHTSTENTVISESRQPAPYKTLINHEFQNSFRKKTLLSNLKKKIGDPIKYFFGDPIKNVPEQIPHHCYNQEIHNHPQVFRNRQIQTNLLQSFSLFNSKPCNNQFFRNFSLMKLTLRFFWFENSTLRIFYCVEFESINESEESSAALAQLGERQTEDLKAPCSIHGGGTLFR